MGGVPSIPRDSEPRLQVIGAGYSRTGTVAMQLALEKLLDGPVMHGGTQILSREDAYTKKWVDAYAAKRAGNKPRTRKLLAELLAGFVGCTDMPPLDFIPELLEIYPAAKVVLVTRDPQRWLESIRPVANNAEAVRLPLTMMVVPGWRWFPALSREFGASTAEYLGLPPDEAPTNPEPCVELLLNWNERVKALVPPEKLLIMELGDGWEPLCKFLDLPVPDDPFPRANDSAAAGEAAQDIADKLFKIWLGIISASAGIVGFSAWLFLKRRYR